MRITRAFETKVEIRNEEHKPGFIEGLGAPFYRAGDPGTEYRIGQNMMERYDPQAFEETIIRDDIVASFNHNLDNLLGRSGAGTLRLWTDARGLHFKVQMGDTTAHRDTMERIERGDVIGASVMFMIEDSENDQEFTRDGETDIRLIKRAKLIEIGPVAKPAYESTTADMRSEFEASRELWLPKEKSFKKRNQAKRFIDIIEIGH